MSAPVVEEEIQLPETAVAALVEAEGLQTDAVIDMLIAQLVALWVAFGEDGDNFYDGSAVQDFAARVGRLVVGAQRVVGRITEQHLRQQIRLNFPDVALPNSRIVDLPSALRTGATPDEVYQRPIRQVRYLESETGGEVPRETAVETARQRLEKAALHDMQLARAVSAQQVMYRFPAATGWRRIIHPELGNVCGLCIAAADRVYQRLQRLSLHPGCKCSVLPVVGGLDPGNTLNAEDLRRLYAAAGSTATENLRRIRIKTDEHGEMGDILLPDGSVFKDPRDVRNQLSERQLDLRRQQLQRQVDELRSRRDLSQWHQDRLAQLENLLAAA